jgi:YVTN family beta-propeller protein
VRRSLRRALCLAVSALTLAIGTAAVTGGGPAAAAGNSLTAYVSDENGSVVAVDLVSGSVRNRISVGGTWGKLAATPDGSRVYAAISNGQVSEIATGTDEIIATFPTGGFTLAAAVTPNGATLYVVDASKPGVTPIDIATRAVGASIPVGNFPQAIGISPDGAHAYVANAADKTITAIDTATGTVSATIPLPGGPIELAIAPDGTKAYAVTVDAATDAPTSVTPVDLLTGSAAPPIPMGGAVIDVAFTPNGSTAYVTVPGLNHVVPIATATNTPGLPIGVSHPFGVALSHDGSTAFVTTNLDASITPISTATNTVGAPIPIGVTARRIVLATVRGATATALSASAASVPVGEPVTFRATVSAQGANSAPTGSVTFFDESAGLYTSPPSWVPAVLATVPLSNGVAAVTTSFGRLGGRTVRAIYNGDATNAMSAATTTITVPVHTMTTVTSSTNPSVLGSPVTFTFAVAPVGDTYPASGNVTLYDGATVLRHDTLWIGPLTYTTSSLAVGSHSITAVYGGDQLHVASTSAPLTQVVNRVATQTTLSATRTPPAYALTATISSAPGSSVAATGTVTFREGATILGVVAVQQDLAVLNPKLSGRSHQFTASYSGDGTFLASSSPVVVSK